MRYVKCLAALVLVASFGAVHACPDNPGNQSKSTKVEKPLAPKPSA